MKKITFGQRRIQKNLFLTVMLAIPVLHFFVFWLYLNVDSFMLAFKNLLGDWVGTANFEWVFRNIFSDNPSVDMSEAVRNTITFWLFGVLVESPISIIISYFFYKKIKGCKVYKIITYLPCIIGTAVMVAVFKGFIRSGGPLDEIVQFFGGDPVPKFLYDSRYAMKTMLIYNLWSGFGINLILYSGAMERIPKEVVEYALLDGVTPVQEIIHITFPLIWSTWSMCFILSVGNIFTSSGPTLLMTGGEWGTMTIAYSMYQQVYFYKQIVRAAAIGSIFTVLGVPLVMFSRWVVNKIREPEEY